MSKSKQVVVPINSTERIMVLNEGDIGISVKYARRAPVRGSRWVVEEDTLVPRDVAKDVAMAMLGMIR